jgi:hypothetical protein
MPYPSCECTTFKGGIAENLRAGADPCSWGLSSRRDWWDLQKLFVPRSACRFGSPLPPHGIARRLAACPGWGVGSFMAATSKSSGEWRVTSDKWRASGWLAQTPKSGRLRQPAAPTALANTSAAGWHSWRNAHTGRWPPCFFVSPQKDKVLRRSDLACSRRRTVDAYSLAAFLRSRLIISCLSPK